MAKTLSNINPNLNTSLKSELAQGADVGDTGISNGQSYRWTGVNWDPQGGSSSSGGSMGSGASWEDTVKKAIEMQQQAAQPAIAQYQSTIPSIQSNYEAQKANVTAQQQTLQDRYKTLLDSITQNKTQAVNQQTVITSNELGKRGLLPSSTLAQQEVANAVNPINQNYENQTASANNDETSGLQSLQSLLTQLTGSESNDVNSVNNAIAQLQSGAATNGISTGTNVWNQNQQTLAAQAAQTYKAQQDEIANKIAQSQLVNQTTEANKPNTTTFQDSNGHTWIVNAATGQKITDLGAGYNPKSVYPYSEPYISAKLAGQPMSAAGDAYAAEVQAKLNKPAVEKTTAETQSLVNKNKPWYSAITDPLASIWNLLVPQVQ